VAHRDAGWIPDEGRRYQTDGTAVGLSVVGEKYFAGFHDVVPYAGLGVGYAYESDDYRYDYNYYDDGDYDWDHNTSTSHSGTLTALVGAQWRLKENVSLGGEYHVTGSLGRNEYTSTETRIDNGSTVVYRDHRKRTESSVGFESGRLLLAVRF
jgi:opacity protein-like surface antigen